MLLTKRYDILSLADEKNLPCIYDILCNAKELSKDVACTDGKYIYINPIEFNTYSAEDGFFILCHELLHIVYRHHDMMKDDKFPDKELLNICQDIVINEYLAKRLKHKTQDGMYLSSISGLLRMWGYLNRDLTYTGSLTTKDVYNYLERYKGRSKFDDFLHNYMDDKIYNDSTENMDNDAEIQQITNEVRKAFKISDEMLQNENNQISVEQSDDWGDGFGYGTEGKLTKLNKRKAIRISKEQLIKYISKYIGDNVEIRGRSRSYSRPNRRFQSNDLLLKGYKRTKTIKEICIYLDTSGSMSQMFVNDVTDTLKNLYKTVKFKFYTFDYFVRSVDMNNSNSIYTGGGTSITNVLNHIVKNKQDVSILITDCQDTFTLKGFKHEMMIFTNNYGFISNQSNVKVTYFD